MSDVLTATTAQIVRLYGESHLPVHFTYEEYELECWLPLKSTEPANKTNKSGLVGMRTPQDDRGGYFQMGRLSSPGLSAHVYYFSKAKDEAAPAAAPTPPDEYFEYHVSHRCHHWWCCRPLHTLLEPDWANIRRGSCKGFGALCECWKLIDQSHSHTSAPCVWFAPRFLTKNFDDAAREAMLNLDFLKSIPKPDRDLFKTANGPNTYQQVVTFLVEKKKKKYKPL